MSDVFKIIGLISVIITLWSDCIQAQNYYDQHAVGWHWYDDPLPQEKYENDSSVDPITQVKAIKHSLENALDEALLNPTPLHVKNYIQFQNEWSERASQFSKMWQWVLLQHPELDYSITHPTNQVARTVYLDALNHHQDIAIKTLAKQNGLFFFYRSSCSYCQRFAPIVKNFSERYGMPVIPITTDGIALPQFPQSRINHGQAQHFQVKVVPALFTVNPYTHRAIPVAYGLISESDLRQRILDIANAQEKGTL